MGSNYSTLLLTGHSLGFQMLVSSLPIMQAYQAMRLGLPPPQFIKQELLESLGRYSMSPSARYLPIKTILLEEE